MSFAHVHAVFGSRLDPRLKPVAVAFAHYTNQEEFAWPGIGTIAKHWGLSRRWVQHVTRELEVLGVLRDTQTHRHRSRVYRFDVAALQSLPAGGHSAAWATRMAEGRTRVRTFRSSEPRTIVRTSGDSVVRTPTAAKCEPLISVVRTPDRESVNPRSPEHQEDHEHQENTPALRAGLLSYPGENDDARSGGFEQVRQVMTRIADLPPLPRRSRAAQARRPMGPGA